ncbi:MAG: hypothetical protein BA871_16905 [Desulfuromonadales bacterium C00003096]|nr:MAG: hypothetical protein BA871_16905 [Desulfuromonadales bacterium C00003096]
MKLIKSNLREHFLLIGVCFFYFTAVFAIDQLTYSKIMGSLNYYYFVINKFLLSFLILFSSIKTVVYLITNFHAGPSCLREYWQTLKKDYLTKDAVFRFGIVYLLIPPFMCSYSSLKQSIPVFKSFDSDVLLSRLDYLIHFNNTPWALLQVWIGHPSLTRFLDFCYIAWGAIFIYTLLWMACSRRKELRLQFLLSLVFCWIIIGNALATLLASVGPCYYAHVAPGATANYSTMLTYLRTIPDLQAIRIQDTLWEAYSVGKFMPLGGISAMPSMHVSIAVLMALAYRRMGRWVGLPFMLYAVVIQIGSVHLGWHYAIDGYVSILMTVLIWKGVEKINPFVGGKPVILPASPLPR